MIVQGKPTEISPATLYETDKHFQDWVEKKAVELKRRFGGHVSRSDLVAALTNGGGHHKITTNLQTYFTERGKYSAPGIVETRLSVMSEETAYPDNTMMWTGDDEEEEE